MRSSDDREFSRRSYVEPDLPQSGVLYELMRMPSGEPGRVELVRTAPPPPRVHLAALPPQGPAPRSFAPRLIPDSSVRYQRPTDVPAPETMELRPPPPAMSGDTGRWITAALGAAQLRDGYRAWRIRERVGENLTRGGAGNFPINRAMAHPFTARWTYAGRPYATLDGMRNAMERGELPFSQRAGSHEIVDDGLERTRMAAGVAKAARRASWALGPATGAVNGYMTVRDDDSPGTKFAKTLLGAVKALDNTAIAGGAGLAAGIAAAPSAPVTLGMGPVVAGTAAGIAADYAYEDSYLDTLFNDGIDHLAPTVATGADGVINLVDRAYRMLPAFTDRYWGFSDDEVAPGS